MAKVPPSAGAKEFRRFLDIALGSTAELSYCLLLSKDLGYMGEPEYTAKKLRNEAGQRIWQLHQALTAKPPD